MVTDWLTEWLTSITIITDRPTVSERAACVYTLFTFFLSLVVILSFAKFHRNSVNARNDRALSIGGPFRGKLSRPRIAQSIRFTLKVNRMARPAGGHIQYSSQRQAIDFDLIGIEQLNARLFILSSCPPPTTRNVKFAERANSHTKTNEINISHCVRASTVQQSDEQIWSANAIDVDASPKATATRWFRSNVKITNFNFKFRIVYWTGAVATRQSDGDDVIDSTWFHLNLLFSRAQWPVKWWLRPFGRSLIHYRVGGAGRWHFRKCFDILMSEKGAYTWTEFRLRPLRFWKSSDLSLFANVIRKEKIASGFTHSVFVRSAFDCE